MARFAVIGNAIVLEERRGELSRVMAVGTVLGRRQVGNEFPDADDIVVAHSAIANDADVIVDTAGECAGGVAHGAIFGCRHMVDRLAERIGPVVAGIAAHRGHHLSRVVDKCTDKAHRVMACTTVRGGHRMISRNADCSGSIVASGTGLCDRIEDRVVESTAHVKRPDAMARPAIHVRQGMVLCLPGRINAVVTGDTAIRYVAVVHIRREKGICFVTEIALAFSCNVPVILARGCRSIVAQGAATGHSGVVVTAVRQAIQEVLGIVASIAFLGRRNMMLGFTNGHDAIVTFAAIPKDFLMIDSRDRGKIWISVARLTVIAGRDVIRRFTDCNYAIVTGCAVVHDADMIEERTREAGGVMAGDTILGCWNMCYRLTSGPGIGVAAIVTGDAVSVDSLVIEGAAGKGGGGMTDVTTQCSGNMPLRFADCCHAVAGITVVEDDGMIHPASDKTAGSVAYATVLIGQHMVRRFALGKHAVVA